MQGVLIKSMIIAIIAMFFMVGCASKEQRFFRQFKKNVTKPDNEQEKLWSDNCSGYTFNYTDKFPGETDSVTVYGKIYVCSTGKIPSETILSFYNEKDSLEKQIKVDRTGKYQVRLKAGAYERIEAISWGAKILIPQVYLGEVGSSMNIDLKLLRIYLL